MNTLSKAPISYCPSIINNKYQDSIEQYKWSDFGVCGFICPCSKTKTIHRNKNSFIHSHCKTKSHIKYLELLNKNLLNKSPLDISELKKEVKTIKIQLVKEHETLQLEKHKNKTLITQIKDLVTQKDEIESELKQTQTFIEETLKEKITLQSKIEKYEKLLEQMLNVAGYDIEISE